MFYDRLPSDMNHDDMVKWAKGNILISIGEGKFSEVVWQIVNAAWTRGYQIGLAKQKESDKS